MGTYVAHRSAPATRYAELGDTGLLSLFSTEQWGNLSYAEKLDACQEVENRYAAAHNCESCTVRAEPMTGATFGYQNNHAICLNEGVVRDGVFLTEDVDENGATVLVPVDVRASNWQTLETVFHEGTHGIQESRGQMPGTYFDPESDYDIYRIQPMEKEAFQAGQENTLRAIAALEKESGKLDPAAADYLAAVKAASYEASLEAAARNYGDENIDVTVATLIQHREYGLTLQNPSESYKVLGELLDEQEKQLEEAQNEANWLQEEHQLQQEALSVQTERGQAGYGKVEGGQTRHGQVERGQTGHGQEKGASPRHDALEGPQPRAGAHQGLHVPVGSRADADMRWGSLPSVDERVSEARSNQAQAGGMAKAGQAQTDGMAKAGQEGQTQAGEGAANAQSAQGFSSAGMGSSEGDAHEANADDGLNSALGAHRDGMAASDGAYASDAPAVAHEGAAQGADDGLGSTAPGMDDSPSGGGGEAAAGASNDNDDAGGSLGGGSDGSGGGGGGGGSDRGGGQDM